MRSQPRPATVQAMDTNTPHKDWAGAAVARLLDVLSREAAFELARWALQLGREQ